MQFVTSVSTSRRTVRWLPNSTNPGGAAWANFLRLCEARGDGLRDVACHRGPLLFIKIGDSGNRLNRGRD
jgi:hypothetical protein